MKKILMLLSFIPMLSFAQPSTLIDLSEYGLSATINASDFGAIESITKKDNPNKVLEIKILFENGEKIKIIEIPKPKNYAIFKKMILDLNKKSPNKTKILINAGNDLLIETTMLGSGDKRYSVITGNIGKARQLVIGAEVNDSEQTARAILSICKTFKYK